MKWFETKRHETFENHTGRVVSTAKIKVLFVLYGINTFDLNQFKSIFKPYLAFSFPYLEEPGSLSIRIAVAVYNSGLIERYPGYNF